MPTDQEIDRAEEAASILSNPLLGEAFEEFRLEALAALADVDATDTAAILKLQAEANCIRSVVDRLNALILRVKGNDGYSMQQGD